MFLLSVHTVLAYNIVLRKDIKYAAVIKKSNFNEGGFYRRRGEEEEMDIS